MLNDDCLLLICGELSIRDQFVLLQLEDARLGHLILDIWKRKYGKQFDWHHYHEEEQLKLLSAREQSQLLHHMANRTQALLNLHGSCSEVCLDWLSRIRGNRQCLPRMLKMSFRECNSLLLRQLPEICINIVHLQLGWGVGLKPADLGILFGQLKQLTVFELHTKGSRNHNGHGNRSDYNYNCVDDNDNDEDYSWTNIKYGQTLQTLKLPACIVRATAMEIHQLPQLRQLTGFLCCCSASTESATPSATLPADDKANAAGNEAATNIISACLQALHGCQIVGLHLQCQLDASLPRLLLSGAQTGAVRLHRLAWHSQLTVHYDAMDGSIKWLPQQPQVAHALLPFIASQAKSLHELDFTRNIHATPTFLTKLAKLLPRYRSPALDDDDDDASTLSPSSSLTPISVWHDNCSRVSTATDATETNDLAFVDLELQRLLNEHGQDT
ncbi:uncharacterized protein Dwil_GK27535 [Drosophila willistoni]|uniref:F-box domain-containing protein n=1 Tax=Drosophila willistoni TaxID=7260 RepID=A0A0Q9X4I1_DROWI|nr:uncharacterized protein LOC26529537 [Drosophila willistoni]KRF99202.1 uncharacterized protein Dwil_GK27535 [Drosophila willistoni]